MMAGAQGPFLAAVLLLVSSGLHCSSPLPSCPDSCTCQTAPLLNCSSAGLSLLPQQIQDSVTNLDLSHNLLETVTLDRPHHNLRNVWLGNNSITHFSLCIRRSVYVRGRHLHRLRPWRGHGCVSWAPTLQLLSVERNQLEELPQGLEASESLQVLQLSFNRISTLQPGDLSQLRKLKELHLQHNLIQSLHPQMFQDLVQLRVLDLSFNMLTSVHPLMYFTLRNIGADVDLGGNRWQCDCSMRSLRKHMAYDSSRGMGAWSMVCASPSILSGRDLLQLEEIDLNCFSAENLPELHQDVTVLSGSDIVLSCTTQDSKWWTPSGQASLSQPQAGLLINDITERDTGLYVCVSEEHEIVSVFNLQISKIGGARRKIRSLPRTSQEIIPKDRPNSLQEKNQRATQSDLALAVCLSIFITFLIAFILGVLARPCVDVLWRRITKKESSSAVNSVSSVERRQYDNEAYSDGGEPEHIGHHRERRVTFSNLEDSNVQYYDTVAGANQESINSDAVIECEAAEADKDTNRAGDSGSEHSLQQSSPEDHQRGGRNLSTVTDAGHTHNIEYEHIPDPDELEKRRSMSSDSDSSVSDKVINEEHMTPEDHSTPKTNQLTEDSVQQRADFPAARKVEVPQISIEGTSKLPDFSSEPFTDWSPHTNNPNLTDPDLWQENEEQFEFSDSVRSTSERSSGVHGSFNGSKQFVAPTFKKKTDDMSSSSSYVSEDEPTQYTVNSDQEQEVIESNHEKSKDPNACLKQDSSFEQQINIVNPITPSVRFNQGDHRYDTQRPAVRPEDSISSHSSDSDQKDYIVKKGFVPSLAVTSHGMNVDTKTPSPSTAYLFSSSSESEAETTDLKMGQNKGCMNKWINEPETLSTDLDCQRIPQIKRHVNINAPLTASYSSSSDESMDETTKHTKKQEQGPVGMVGLPIKEYQSVSHNALKPQWPNPDLDHATPIKGRLDIRAPSPPTNSSSSDESADESINHMQKQKQGVTHVTALPTKESQTCHDSDTQWPAVDLENTTRIMRHLDIKAPSPASDSSSSSDSEGETTNYLKEKEQGDAYMARLPDKVSLDLQTQWPALDLMDIPCIKRRLDVKTRSPPPDSSSSSDSEEETTKYIKKQEQGEMSMARPPSKVSQTTGYEPQTQWPVLDFEHTTSIKRRLDIKAPSPDSSSSSDSEDETTHHSERPGKVDIAGLPVQESPTGSHDPGTRWPALDLEHIPHIKQRLDIKAPSPPPDSSSSSDSEEETTNYIKKQEQGEMSMARPPSTVSQTTGYEPQTQWPALDFEQTTSIKRRLDIKLPSPDSSSSSDSEKEPTHPSEKPGNMNIAGLPVQESPTGSHDPGTSWPSIDLEHIPHIKQRLDIKATSPPPDSSSSSDSEEETTNYIKKQEQGEMSMARPPSTVSQTTGYEPQTQWPALDFEQTTSIKRRLDIKVPSPDLSSSSDSEEEPTHPSEKPGNMDIAGLPVQESPTASHDPGTSWPSIDLEHIPHIKQRLDIKATSPPPDSSSSGDSEEETTNYIKKQEQGEMSMARPPSKVSQTTGYEPRAQWPALDFEQTTRIKRRLDIKAPSPDSSSSSDSEEEPTHPSEKPGNMDIAGLPVQESPTGSHDPGTRWPVIDLEHIPHIKQRLDIKATSPPLDSSSSSDSEEETTNYIKKQEQGEVSMARPPSKVSQTTGYEPQTQWPALDFEQTTSIKRRLDIKVPSPDLSSSSDSEEEPTHPSEKPGNMDMARLPFQESPTGSHDPGTRWPSIDLEHIPHIKQRLDIKATSLPLDSSSSSDSEEETTNYIKKQEQGEMSMARPPSKVSQTTGYEPQTQWPALDFEHTTSIKRRLDIKAPSPDLSSSSDSEDETTGSHDQDIRWPALDLGHIPCIKRRLDIKARSPPPDSSSSNDSEEETKNYIQKLEQGEMSVARPPSKVSQTASNDAQTQWPALDLEHTTSIKRRLDIKAPDSSSGSDSEDETKHQPKKTGKVDIAVLPLQKSQTVNHDPQRQWPALDLENTTSVKRRLDIKAPSTTSYSSSSDSENKRTHLTNRPGVVGTAGLLFQESQTASHDPETQWPSLDLGNITCLKRRLDIKARSPSPDLLLSGGSTSKTVERKGEETIKSPRQSSSSSDEQEVGMKDLRYRQTTVEPEPEPRQPQLDLSKALHVKRRLDITAPSPPPESFSSSDESEVGTTKLSVKVQRVKMEEGITSYQPGRKLPDMNVSVPPVKRRLNIKGPSQPDVFLSSVSPGSRQPESNSSSDSDDEPRDKTKLGLGASAMSKTTEKKFIRSQKAPVINIPRNSKTDHNVKLEKYTFIADEVGEKTTSDKISTTPEINPELQSRWATMNLGISRFRKRLEITSHEPPKLPSTPPPGSPSSSSSESEIGSKSSSGRRKIIGVGMQESSRSPETKQVNVSLSASHFRRSNSENEIISHSVPDLSLGIPRIKRRLNVKAPLPEPSNSQSSSSESENEVARYTANQSGHVSSMSDMTDYDSLIMYKRVIIKSPSPESNSFSSSGKGQNIDQTKQKLPSVSFDDIVKNIKQQPKHTTDLPPEIRWTRVGRQLSDRPIPSLRRDLDVGLSSPKQALLAKPELPPSDSSSSSSSESDDNIKQERGKADVTLMHKHSSLGASSVSPVSNRVLDKFDTPPSSTNEILRTVSVDSKERKGLSALKAMSSDRRKWDMVEKLDIVPSPLFDDHGSQGDTSFNYGRSEKAIKPLVKQSLTGLGLSSTSVERRATDLSYGIPRYRRHNIEPPKEAPPPIPSTPPPYEAVGLTWRSTQSSTKQELQGTRSYLEQSRNTKESEPSLMPQNLAVYFDPSNVNISEV